MVSFEYEIQDEMGVHARPAGLFVKEIRVFDKVDVFMTNENGTKVDAKSLLSVMGLAVKHGQKVTISVEGDSEKEVAGTILQICQKHF